jgi:hypothetical protein
LPMFGKFRLILPDIGKTAWMRGHFHAGGAPRLVRPLGGEFA